MQITVRLVYIIIMDKGLTLSCYQDYETDDAAYQGERDFVEDLPETKKFEVDFLYFIGPIAFVVIYYCRVMIMFPFDM